MSGGALVFECYSVWQLLGVWRIARRVRRVYVLDPAYAVDQVLGGRLGSHALLERLGLYNTELSRRLFLWVLSWLNPEVETLESPMELLASHVYRLNQEGPPRIDRVGPGLFEHSLIWTLREIVGDDPVLVRYLQGFLALVEPRWRLFAFVARDLVQSDATVTVVPEGPLDDQWDDPALDGVRRAVPPRVDRINRIRYVVRLLAARLVLWLMPIGLFLTHARHGVRRRPDGPYEVVMPVAWGVYPVNESLVRFGVKRSIDDLFLYGAKLTPGRILHLFGDIGLAAENEETFRQAMVERGLPFRDRRRFSVTWAFVREALRAELMLLRTLRPLPADRISLALLSALSKGVYHYLRVVLEMGNIDYQVAFVRNDYNPGHVIHTLVAHRHGRKVAGAAHAASLFDAPQLAYVHLDRYFAQCEIYSRTYGTYWDDVGLVRSGRESLDTLWTQSNQDVDAIRARVRELYGDRRFFVLLMFPSMDSKMCLAPQWREMHEGVRRLAELELDAHIFLRFRQATFGEHPHGVPIVQTAERDPRMILDHTNFSTLELQSASDLVVTANAAFGINEAALAGKRIFTFGYTLKEDLYFPPDIYGSDFVLKTADDLVRAVAGVASGFDGVDCRWDLLRQDSDYYADGRNCDRIRKGVLELCRAGQGNE